MIDGAHSWAKWDFASLEDWKVDHCWTYEFTRLVPGLVRCITAWRKQVPRRAGQDLFDAYRLYQGGLVTPFIQIDNHLFLIPLGAYYLLPDWPEMPFLEMPPVRFKQLKKLSEDEKDWVQLLKDDTPGGPPEKELFAWKKARTELREIDPHPGQYGLDFVSCRKSQWDDDSWKRLTESLKESILDSNTLRAFHSEAEVLAFFRIDWARSDKQLLALFRKWLASNRPTAFKKHGTLGRSHALPKKRTELEYLRKYLIVQDTGDWRVSFGRNRLFRDRTKWNECRTAVDKVIADLSSYPGCTG